MLTFEKLLCWAVDCKEKKILHWGLSKFFQCSQILNAFFHRDSTIKDLETSLKQKKDDIARVEAERTELIAKVQRNPDRANLHNYNKVLGVKHMKKNLDIMKTSLKQTNFASPLALHYIHCTCNIILSK